MLRGHGLFRAGIRDWSNHRKVLLLISLLVAMFFLGALRAEAVDYFVRYDAVGANNGSDWTNAYTSLPSTLARGATYYIADGSYGNYTFDDAESGATYIYLKKATGTDHGSDSGWQSNYGDGQAAFSRWTFNQGYYDINGQTGGGPGSWDSGFGFTVSSSKGERVSLNANVDHITVTHTEITNSDNSANDVDFGHLINAQTNVSYITFSYCKIHHVFGCVLKSRARNDYWTVEYSKLGDNTGTSANHSEIWSTMGSDNFTIRYNWLFKWRSTGGLIAMNGPKGTYDDNAISESWKIYGNVFEQGGTTASWVIAAFSNTSYDQFARYWTVVNNTFINMNSTASSVYLCSLDTYGTSDNVFVNNITYGNSDMMIVEGTASEDYNFYQGSGSYFAGAHDVALSGSPFVDYSGGDYQLTDPLTGIALSGEYNEDIYGLVRGDDGVWDTGAFEFTGAIAKRPSPPTNLHIVLQ